MQGKESGVDGIGLIGRIVENNYMLNVGFDGSLIDMEWMLEFGEISVYDIYNYGVSSHGTAPIPNDHEQLKRSIQLEIWMRQIRTKLYEENTLGMTNEEFWSAIDKEIKQQSKFWTKDIYFLGVLHAQQSAKLQHLNGQNGYRK